MNINNKQFSLPLAMSLCHPELYRDDEDIKSIWGHEDPDKLTADDEIWSPSLFEKKAYEFFNSINDKNRPEYWSYQKYEYDIEYNKRLSEYFNDENTTYEDIVEYWCKRILKYLSCEPEGYQRYRLYGTFGNSKPSQYEGNGNAIGEIAGRKLIEKYGVTSTKYELPLGYGHVAKKEMFGTHIMLCIDPKKKVFKISFCPQVIGDKGFHDEMKEQVHQMKLDIERFKRKSHYFKTPVDELIKEIKNIEVL